MDSDEYSGSSEGCLPPDIEYTFSGEASDKTGWAPKIIQFLTYWQSKAKEAAGIPPREAIDPLDIMPLMREVWMADINLSPFRMRYRLVGTGITYQIGKDPTGQWIDEVFPTYAKSFIEAEARLVAEEDAVSLYKGPPLMTVSQDVYRVQRVTVPLRGKSAPILMGLNHYTSALDSEPDS